MKASEFFNFLRSHPLLVVTMILTALAIGAAQVWKSRRPPPADKVIASFTSGVSNVSFATSRPIPPPMSATRLVSPASHETTTPAAGSKRPDDLTTIHATSGRPYAPSHWLLRCVLVNAVDSAMPDAPIIGVVTEDLWHAGELVVPKGTEIHGRAVTERIRDRILSQTAWTLVWQSGEELVVTGRALNREPERDGSGWSLTDGSVGLAGAIIRSESLDEIKLFLATALSGFAMGMQQQSTSVLGIEHTPATARNAAMSGTIQVLNQYSQEVLQAIKKDGIYVMVAPGKSFYVLVEGPIDCSKAHIADEPLPPSGSDSSKSSAVQDAQGNRPTYSNAGR
jgi:hypothetical protein